MTSLQTCCLLQTTDNDVSHIYCILISVDHVVNTDNSPEPHTDSQMGEKEVKKRRVHL